ncbi:rCG49241, partial [Rattus norvegicus]
MDWHSFRRAALLLAFL